MARRRQVLVAAIGATALAVGGAGCGDDDDDANVTAPGTTTETSTAPPTGTTTSDAGEDQGITGGETTLRLDPDVADAFGTAQIEVSALDPASGDDPFTFPVTGGTAGGGTLDHSGGLRFSVAGVGIEARDFRLDIATGELTAEVEGRRVPLLLVETGGGDVETDDGLTVSGAPVYLDRDSLPAVSGALEAIGQQDERLQLGEVDVEAETS